MDKTSAEEKICLAEKEKVDLLNQLTAAKDNIENLELNVKEEQQNSFKLREELDIYCHELENLNIKYKNLNEANRVKSFVI